MGETNSMNKLVVTISANGDSCNVTPVNLQAVVGDEVTFQNLTDYPVIIFFPDANLFGLSTRELAPGTDFMRPILQVETGEYPYTVYYKGKEKFVSKASMPSIIVYRKIS